MCPPQQRRQLGLLGQATRERTTSTVEAIPAMAMAIPMATTAILAMATPTMAMATRVSGEQQQETVDYGFIYFVLYSGAGIRSRTYPLQSYYCDSNEHLNQIIFN